jgi:hypothetical protein
MRRAMAESNAEGYEFGMGNGSGKSNVGNSVQH